MSTTHAFALTFFLSVPCFAQNAVPELEVLVRDRAGAAASTSLQEVWQSSLFLTQTAGTDGRAELDAIVDRLLGSNESWSEHAVLLLAQVRLAGTEPDVVGLSQRLLSLLDSRDEAVGADAATLLGDPSFRLLKDEDRTHVVERLSKAAADGNTAPRVRVAAALALHAQGGGAAVREARSTLSGFLQSADPGLRALGALGLAQTGDTETPRTELERLAAIPDENGRLAAAYLKQEEMRRTYDRYKRKLSAEGANGGGTVDLKGDPGHVRIEALIRLIEQQSLEGEVKKRDDLIDAALDGMMRSLDEHSSYLPPKSYREFVQDLISPEYGGIGAYVGEDPDDHLFTIRQPIYSGPAYRAGLHSDDKIVRIDTWPTFTPQGMRPVDEIIKRLKGKPGTKVKLYIWRRGMDPALIDRPTEEMAIEIVREEITIPPVKADLLPGGIAYVELTTFSKVASDELVKKLKEFQGQGLRGVVLDLRQNTGGLLTEAVNVANLFLPEDKLIVTTVSRRNEQVERTSNPSFFSPDVPVAVLVSRFSASASEIVSGALQDYNRAQIVGQRTFGKGSVQSLMIVPGQKDDEFDDENDNGQFDPWEKLTKDYNKNGEFDFAPRARMTIARYLLPSGRSIHREFDEKGEVTSEGGVEPDIRVDPKRYESWKIEEMNRIMKTRKLRDYLDGHFAQNRELFRKLADCDMDDPSLYPDFDALYASLGTTLSAQDVRFLLRREVRGRAQDERGAAFPEGDFQEDPMLQRGIEAVLEKLGTKSDAIPQYAHTFEPESKTNEHSSFANLTDAKRTNLQHALTLIGEAKGGATLSTDRLAEIERALQSMLDR